MNLIGENIRKYRRQANWTQEDLAKMLKVHVKHVSSLERGRNIPSPSMIEKLCDAFCIDELTLRFGERKENDEKSMELLLVEKELDGLSLAELLQVCLYAKNLKEGKSSTNVHKEDVSKVLP